MMKKIKITIETVNSAFTENAEQEVANILKNLAEKLEDGRVPSKLFDINGNTVGKVDVR